MLGRYIAGIRRKATVTYPVVIPARTPSMAVIAGLDVRRWLKRDGWPPILINRCVAYCVTALGGASRHESLTFGASVRNFDQPSRRLNP